ncbi:Transcriptional regulator GlxA family [Cupriavidus necator]
MRHVALALYPGFQALNLAVSTVLEFANRSLAQPMYEVHLCPNMAGWCRVQGGFSVSTEPFGRRRFDTVLVVGDNDVLPAPPALVIFLRRAARTSRRIGATCTGAFNLAEAGLLDGRRATTHWYYAEQLRRRFPEVGVEEDRIFIIDGPVWTSAGMSACIDLALALVEKDAGGAVARDVVRKLVVYHRRARRAVAVLGAAGPGTAL